jgi:hypothetical protein
MSLDGKKIALGRGTGNRCGSIDGCEQSWFALVTPLGTADSADRHFED